MNTISDATSLTDLQKTVFDQLHSTLDDDACSAITRLPADHPLSPHSSRSLESPQAVKPLAILSSLLDLNVAFDPLSELLLAAGIGLNPTTPLTDPQKQVVAKLRTPVGIAAGDIAATVKLDVLSFVHQSRSVQEVTLAVRSLASFLEAVKRVLVLITLGVIPGAWATVFYLLWSLYNIIPYSLQHFKSSIRRSKDSHLPILQKTDLLQQDEITQRITDRRAIPQEMNQGPIVDASSISDLLER